MKVPQKRSLFFPSKLPSFLPSIPPSLYPKFNEIFCLMGTVQSFRQSSEQTDHDLDPAELRAKRKGEALSISSTLQTFLLKLQQMLLRSTGVTGAQGLSRTEESSVL
jgi:hypothetical protein